MSPLHYQRAQRLNGARQAIKQHQRIADAATAWGFWHFGRFSRESTLSGLPTWAALAPQISRHNIHSAVSTSPSAISRLNHTSRLPTDSHSRSSEPTIA